MIRRILLFGLLCGLSACNQTQDAAKKGAVGVVKTAPDRAKAMGDLTAVTGALQTYYVQNNSTYPASLDELKLNLYNPADLVYDPKTGKVHSKAFPNL